MFRYSDMLFFDTFTISCNLLCDSQRKWSMCDCRGAGNLREFEKSVEVRCHERNRTDALFYETGVCEFLCISHDLEISRDDGERSLEFMSRIVDKVLHTVEVVIDRTERLSYKVSSHEVKWYQYQYIEREKSEDITDDIIDRVSTLSKKNRKGIIRCISYFSHHYTVFFESDIRSYSCHDGEIYESLSILSRDRSTDIDDSSTGISDQSIHPDDGFAPLICRSPMSDGVYICFEILFLVESLSVESSPDKYALKNHEK